MARNQLFVVTTYDIPDDKRRLKVAKALLDSGGVRVQRSVFEYHITTRNFERLQARLKSLVDTELDSVRHYILCETCVPRTIMLGTAELTEEPGLLIL
ncbi:MAG: CRISPR-associated endonuclease Cas2 [Caldilineaceae bacterium]|nr:CRISPR-associated endonuclease Cas2 [Caldilineaceae bacterium]